MKTVRRTDGKLRHWRAERLAYGESSPWHSRAERHIDARENGMMRFAKLSKGDFIGRCAMQAEAEACPEWRCLYLEIDAADFDCHGSEAVLHNGEVVGSISSGAWAPYVKRSLAFAFVKAPFAQPDAKLEALVLGSPRSARILEKPLYDPDDVRLRS